ncbi:hypothetical protein F8M41_011123 [Gigaspora margarita]|uniref:Uncharacterized protein n=1 Tax=Gigaspora margarita TaxID=4874 RepID=A0A8H4A0R3_GIGMA|nr:hypothetical protein F8M41_011123 [Gigaspora margarita]
MEILELIVPVTPNIELPNSEIKLTYYWIEHVKNVITFFMKSNDNIQHTLNNLKIEARNNYNEAKDYEDWMHNLHDIYLKRQDDLFRRLNTEISEDSYFRLQRDPEYERLKIEIQCNPFFLIQDWPNYKSKILQILDRINIEKFITNTTFNVTRVPIKNQYADEIVQKQIKIIKRLRKLTYGSVRVAQNQIISIRDLLYEFLPICPSYLNPPNGDYSSQEFFVGKLLPILRMEAEQLFSKKAIAPASFLTIQGALQAGGLRDHSVFECAVCHQYGPTNLKKIKSHLKSHDLDASLNNILLGTKVNCDAVLVNLFHAFFLKQV